LTAHIFLETKVAMVIGTVMLKSHKINNILNFLGGWMVNAFFFVNMSGGIMADTCYPYEAAMNYCKFNPLVVATSVSDVYGVFDEASLEEAVATIGPISVAMYASCEDFFYYKSGIYHNTTCAYGPEDVDHGGELS
jgi:hypothetical protein